MIYLLRHAADRDLPIRTDSRLWERELTDRWLDDGERVLVSSHVNAIGLCLNRLDRSFGFKAWAEMRNPYLFAVGGNRWRRVEL